ncbi:subtilisin-like protease [Dentipellis sp. KUC8613]|nr:subtilisin-like protease [Dentipellis sp. KUC8613]
MMQVLHAILLATSVGLVYGTIPLSQVDRSTSVSFVANKFIVEVDSLSDLPGKRSLDKEAHELVYRSLGSRGITFTVDKEFNSPEFFVGASISLANANDVKALEQTPGVKAIRPVKVVQGPKPVKQHVVSGPDDPQVPPDSESTHILTGVDKLHAQGIFGKGIKIGIIDTGVDYTHPTLGGGIGPDHKIIGGFDFVGDAYDGTNTPIPDPDPLDQCNGHGTHVTGIIGADPGNQFNISGVAFEASLTAYRIFGCTGSVTDDIIIDALLRGVSEGQDILTLSLGGTDGWTESSSAVVASRIAASGKIVTIAAGNDGDVGSWYTSSPGNGINVISAASLDNTVIPLQNATVHGVAHDPITYFATLPLPVTTTLPVFATSNDTSIGDDACSPLPDGTPNLSGFVTVVRRGNCTFVQKLTNVAAKGANVVLIYDNGGGFSAIDVGNFTNATLIRAADGEFLVSEFASGANISLSFPQTNGGFNFPDDAGGLISSFTSYGPTNDFFFKPAVAAPGGNIISTFPVPLGSFAVLSGTSMATPFIAGSAALLFSVKGKSQAVGTGARTLFETTAQRVASSHTDGDPLQTVTQQGAGLINVFNAIHAQTIVSPGELILNDTSHFKGLQTFSVHNSAPNSRRFTLTHIPAGTATTVTPGSIFAAPGPVPLTEQFASVVLSETAFSLGPGQTKEILALILPPSHVDATTFPVFSGFIQIASGTERTQVAYLGLAASLKNKQVVDNTDQFFGVPLPAILDSTGNVQSGSANYTFVGDDFPTLLLRLAFGTAILRVDLVKADINFDPTLNPRGNVLAERGVTPDGSFFSFPHPGNNTFAQVSIVGPLLELDFQPRSSDATDAADNGFDTFAFTNATFANGTAIPNGSYRALLRALKVTGDPTKESDFESWLSPIVGVVVS